MFADYVDEWGCIKVDISYRNSDGNNLHALYRSFCYFLVFFNFNLLLFFAAASVIAAVHFHTAIVACVVFTAAEAPVYQLVHTIVQADSGATGGAHIQNSEYEDDCFFH